MSAVRAAAIRAYEAEQKRRDDYRRGLADQRRREEEQLNAECLAWVSDPSHSHLARLFPDVEWVLVDRQVPRRDAVVHPSDDAELLLIVSSGHNYASVPDPSEWRRTDGRDPKWLVGARQFRTAEELGGIIRDDDRPRLADE